MSVVCKLVCSGNWAGQKSVNINFNAVYEGTAELQGLSTNSLFGTSTPSGQMTITSGRAEVINLFENGEEYFVFLLKPGEPKSMLHCACPLKFDGEVIFVQDQRNYEPHSRSVRVVFREDGGEGSLSLGIVNPAAAGFFEHGDKLEILIAPALGQIENPEVIAYLEAKVIENTAKAKAEEDRLTERNPYVWFTAVQTMKKLARAKGERVSLRMDVNDVGFGDGGEFPWITARREQDQKHR